MKSQIRISGSLILIIHGLIHLMGSSVYLKLAEIEGLLYKTNLLNGFWEVGSRGIAVFGILWIPAAVGFVVVGLVWLIRKTLPKRWIAWITLFSLVLTGLDFSAAYAGILINVIVLVLVLKSQLSEQRQVQRG